MRKLCWFAFPCCAVMFVAGLGLPLGLLLPAGLALLAAGAVAFCLTRRQIGLLCLGLAFGLLWFRGYTQLVRVPAQALIGETTSFSATVTDWPYETSAGNAGVEVLVHLPGAPDPKVLLYTDSSGLSLRPGDTVSGKAKFYTTNIVRGEQVAYYEARGIFLRSNAVGSLTIQHPERIPLSCWGAYISRALKESASAIFPDDVSALMTALLTGDKFNLSDSTYTALQRSGAAHIVAVSGLHLSFFAGFLAPLFPRRSKSGAALTVFLLFLFSAVAGFTPSVLRAAFMITMTLLAPLINREEDRPTTLAAALFVLLLLNPWAAQSVSLQLSFGAVAGIHAFSSPLYRAMAPAKTGGSSVRKLLRKIRRILAANISVTLGALVFTTPLTAWYFGSVSLISPLTNLLILWAVSLAFSAGLLLTLFGLLAPAVAAVLAFPVTLLLRFVLAVTGKLGSLSFASLSMNSVYLLLWLIFVYVLLLLTLLRRYRRPILPVCTCTVALCAALFLTRFSLLSYPLSVTVLDVGQGQSILLCSGGRTALIDCGGSEGNAGDSAANYLNSLGISRLDLLVLTHCHSDHANGVPELFARLEVSSLILPQLNQDDSPYRQEILELAHDEGTEVTLLTDHRALSLGETTLTLYPPLGDGGTNEEGLSLLASCGQFDLLVTGDAGSFVESLLLKYCDLPDIEVLVAGHHGSRHSTSELLLNTVTPETCLISVGYNTYGHPAEETLSRLWERSIDIYRTDLMGNLTIRYKGE